MFVLLFFHWEVSIQVYAQANEKGTFQFKRAAEQSLNELLREVYTSYGRKSIRATEDSIYEQEVGVYMSNALQCRLAMLGGEDSLRLLV